jgi:DNA-binding HxlR family transcriptional regulator
MRRALPAEHTELNCRVRDVLDRVGDKWSVTVIYRLAGGSRRFTELKHDVEGISQRMLTVTLRGLERDGLVTRTVHPVVPPRVDYELTELGETLLDTVGQLMGWSLDHVHDIDRAQKAYDARPAAADLPPR